MKISSSEMKWLLVPSMADNFVFGKKTDYYEFLENEAEQKSTLSTHNVCKKNINEIRGQERVEWYRAVKLNWSQSMKFKVECLPSVNVSQDQSSFKFDLSLLSIIQDYFQIFLIELYTISTNWYSTTKKAKSSPPMHVKLFDLLSIWRPNMNKRR